LAFTLTHIAPNVTHNIYVKSTLTHLHTHSLSLLLSLTHTLSLSVALSLCCSLSHTHSHTHIAPNVTPSICMKPTLTHSHSLCLCLALSHTHTRTHTCVHAVYSTDVFTNMGWLRLVGSLNHTSLLQNIVSFIRLF